MDKLTASQKILLYLEEKRSWLYTGQIDDHLRQDTGTLGGTCERRLREMRSKGLIEKMTDDKGHTLYRIKLKEIKQLCLTTN